MSKVQFDTMKNGYNRYEVDAYVEQAEARIAELEKRVSLYVKQNSELHNSLSDARSHYKAMSDSLNAKEQAAQEMSRMALKEANQIVDTAQRNADQIVREALLSARQILLEVTRLGVETNQLKSKMYDHVGELTKVLNEFETIPTADLDLLGRM
ncbi:MAG: DivIVA domain-containing protein [Erysipelotrichaceae bacterium]